MNRILIPLAMGFRAGTALRGAAYRRGWFRTRRLAHPVISVGNLTVGGTGKTPFVAFLTERLIFYGWKPAILTRGYKRQSQAGLLVIEPGAVRSPDPREVGDEPAWLARKLPGVPIVVARDRFRAGQTAEERLGASLHILDDGFQHLGLARDLDVVLLDVTQEYSDSALLPAGRLREPFSALRRAEVVVLTRVELADPRPIERRVRDVSPHAQIFHASTKLCGLNEVYGGSLEPAAAYYQQPVLAFCGVGRPQAFFQDLRKWGFSVEIEQAFPDHHVYAAEELGRLFERAEHSGSKALLTTEKDAMNLPASRLGRIPLFACAIQVELGEAAAFEASLLRRLEASEVKI